MASLPRLTGGTVIRLFRQQVSTPLLALGLVEAGLLFLSAELAWRLRAAQIGMSPRPMAERLNELLTFTAITWLAMLAVGVYHASSYRSSRVAVTRMAVAVAASVIVLALVYFMFPDVALWRSISLYAVVFSFISVLVARGLFLRLVGWRSFRRRVLVLGAGARAAKLEALARLPEASFLVTRYVRMTAAEPHVVHWQSRADLPSAAEMVEQDGVNEVVVAVEERRGALPLDDLLQVRMTGVRVTDISSFFEQETGRVDLESVRPSWLIFSDGYDGGSQFSVVGKRVFDIVFSATLLIIASPIMILTALLIKATSSGTIFYRQQRVGRFGKSFDVIKFRSMRADAEKEGRPIWAQKSDPRVTAVGRIIRSTRFDELPQMFCVLKGDMSFVGPRPERPFFVADLAREIPFYNERHVAKPGVTGWAQINYPYGASVDDARAKLEYDLYYIKNYSLFLDLLILIQTVRVVLWQDGSRKHAGLPGGGKVDYPLLSEAGLVSHAIACFAFAALGLGAAKRAGYGDAPSRLLIAASLGTALWAFVFVIAATQGGVALALLSPTETLRTALWGAFVVSLISRSWALQDRRGSSFTVAVALGLVVVLQFALDLAGMAKFVAGNVSLFSSMLLFSRMTVAIGGMVLVHNLYVNIAPSSRWSVRLLCIGLGGLFGYDLNLYTLELLTGTFGIDLFNIRGLADALIVPLIAIAASRSHQWRIRLSRQVVFQSFSLVGIGGYLVAMSALGYGLRLVGGDWGRLLQIGFVFAAAILAAVVVFSGQFRAWARVQVNKHFFTSKYDYRQEQRRFVATLSAGEGADGTLAERVIQAVCAIVDSPGGALFTAEADGAGDGGGRETFALAARWNRVLLDVRMSPNDPLARYLGHQGRIVNLDELRAGRGDHSAMAAPDWAMDPRLWLIVPLIHLDRLKGFIVVERSLAARTLNWEDYDLLRTAGRQAASYIAESASQRALAEARKFDEFNRRFAFIMHDIKNVVSQLSLVARNASKHADNPEFQADMVATLNNSVGRMNDLLARLGAKAGAVAERPARVDLTALLNDVAARKRRLHKELIVRANGPLIVEADVARLEAAFEHLTQNAIDASGPTDPVTLSLAREDGMARVDVADAGQGMTPAFLRDGLFEPFHSTKDGGFGVGAYEAREIVHQAHGRLSVVSSPGEGSVFTVLLPLAPTAEGHA